MTHELKLRLITAAALGLFILGVLFLAPEWAWTALTVAVMAGGAWEWASLMSFKPIMRWGFTTLTTLLIVFLAQLDVVQQPIAYLFAGIFWLLLVPLWLARGWALPSNKVLGLLIGWLVLLPAGLAMIYLHQHSALLLLGAIGIPIIADTAAYFAGKAFGRNKLAPSISPGKTREGAFGAAIAITLYALILSLTTESACDLSCIAINLAAFLLLFVLSVLGDLFESWIKRKAGVKDSGNLLPGHGGVLDRVDSHAAVLPVAALLWMLLK